MDEYNTNEKKENKEVESEVLKEDLENVRNQDSLEESNDQNGIESNTEVLEEDIEVITPKSSEQVEAEIEGKDIKPEKKRINKGLVLYFVILAFVFSLFVTGIVMSMRFSGSNISSYITSSNKDASEKDSNVSEYIPQENTFDPNGPKIEIENNTNSKDLSAEQVYADVSPSIVGIVIYENTGEISQDSKGEGSGIIMSQDGYILTNSHVIGDSKKFNVKVVVNGNDEYAGTVIGYDTRTDLAVVKINASNLPAVNFGNSDNIKVGSWVLAIGNPGGMDFANSLTRGIVSALNRSVSSSNPVKYIQTDAAINPGNSGGALVNMSGQVIGINTSKIVSTGFEGMGFAIPMNTAKSVVDDLISQGYVSGRVRLGITGKVVSSYQSKLYSVPEGIIIADISSDSDLSSKDVSKGDIITKVDSVQITGFDVLFSELSKHSAGDEVTLSIYRPKSDKSNESNFDVKVKVLADKGETQNQ